MTRYKIITQEPDSEQKMTIILESESVEAARTQTNRSKNLIIVKIFEPKAVKPQKIKKLKTFTPPAPQPQQAPPANIFSPRPTINTHTESDDTETDVWEQSPAQITGIFQYGFWVLLSTITIVVGLLYEPYIFLILPLCAIGMLIQFIRTASTHFKLTTERIIITKGLLSRSFEELELFRVKDYQLSQPIGLRFFGLSNITIISSDQSAPIVILFALKHGTDVRDKIRLGVLRNREKMQVREIDM